MMLGGLTRQVETVFTVADKASAPAKGIAKSFGNVASSAASVGKIVAGFTAASAGVFLKSVIDIGSEFEETTNSIAGNLKAFNLAPTFAKAQEAAGRALDVIDAKAAKLPGEAEQYIEVFKAGLPKAIESGLTDMTKIADFTSNYTAVAISNQIDSTQAAGDLFRMLSGQAGLDVRTFTALAPHLKMTAKDFNALSIEQRRLALENVVGKFADQTGASADFAGAKIGELTSLYRKLIREGSKPLFEGVKVVLTDVISLISKNQVPIQNFVRAFSEQMLSGIQKLPGLLDTVFKHMDDIKTAAEIFAGIWVTATVTTGIANIIKLVGDLTKAVIALNAASSGGILAKLGGGAVTAAGLATAVGVGAFLLPSEGASQQEMSFEQANRERIRKMQAEDADRKRRIGALGASYQELSSRIGGLMGGVPGVQSVYQQAMKGAIKYKPEDVLETAKLIGYAAEEIDALAVAASATAAAAKVGADGKGKGPSVNIQNARFDIKQSFAEGYDPDRIAVAFTDTLAKLGQYRGQSSFALSGGIP